MIKISLVITIIFTIFSPSLTFSDQTRKYKEDEMVIAIIGNDINENKTKLEIDCEKIIKEATNKIGQSMFNGASLALQCSNRDEFKEFRKYIKLEPHNDLRKIKKAEEIAKEIAKNPNIIAVIGHTSSATTKAAVQTYANSGIPVLTPASSPWIMFPKKKEESLTSNSIKDKVDNVFRILPGDELAQAPAIAFQARFLELEKVLIIREDSNSARTYSKPLCEKVGKILKKFPMEVETEEILNLEEDKQIKENKIFKTKDKLSTDNLQKSFIESFIDRFGSFKNFLTKTKKSDKLEKYPTSPPKKHSSKSSSDANNQNLEPVPLQTTTNFSLKTSVESFDPTGIIYCGYGKIAQKLMTELREIYHSPPPHATTHKPIIIFSEGIGDRRVNTKGFETYMAYPFSDVHDPEAQGINAILKKTDVSKKTDIDILKDFTPPENKFLEIMGYDSMIIIINAIKECKHNENFISRACLLNKLKTKDFVGVLESYYFVNGENKLPTYNMYNLNLENNHFEYDKKINSSDLASTLKRVNQ